LAFSDDEPASSGSQPERPLVDGLIEPLQHAAEGLVDPTPGPIRERIRTLAEAQDARERRAAADWLLQHEPASEVPPYALALAKLERERGCRGRKGVIQEVVDLGDDRALKALERWAAEPRRGCGFLSRRDCYACIRDDLDKAIRVLSGDEPAGDP
jgi:hypothetical protein